VGQLAKIPVPEQKRSHLVFTALSSQQRAPPGIYEVRFYIKGNPIPLAVTDPLESRWPIARVNCLNTSVPSNSPICVSYSIDAEHENAEHSIYLYSVSPSGSTDMDAVDIINVMGTVGIVSFQGSKISPSFVVATRVCGQRAPHRSLSAARLECLSYGSSQHAAWRQKRPEDACVLYGGHCDYIESCRSGAFLCFLGQKYGQVLTEVPYESTSCLRRYKNLPFNL
jgi:hypothetical protein